MYRGNGAPCASLGPDGDLWINRWLRFQSSISSFPQPQAGSQHIQGECSECSLEGAVSNFLLRARGRLPCLYMEYKGQYMNIFRPSRTYFVCFEERGLGAKQKLQFQYIARFGLSIRGHGGTPPDRLTFDDHDISRLPVHAKGIFLDIATAVENAQQHACRHCWLCR